MKRISWNDYESVLGRNVKSEEKEIEEPKEIWHSKVIKLDELVLSLNKYSDDIPIDTYRKLIISIAKKLGAAGKPFALACGIKY